ncbi:MULTISPECIES: hypothetical protein [unclassified Marinobacter]|uniref:hypothetical protein n=1 Tax=unclassified Marinobacter TaxID=83889 RepID=UPI0019262D43|nr:MULTISPECIES: hypothetical protein [unclassified Marinobacter]MBL3824109.1 hypothetical protein [Marinobacter sp. MC3]MBL3892799.1 hypothetical protein [Marinobacter sp. MW3]
MLDFDQDFEQTRLTMLSEQYPNIVRSKGEVSFQADHENRLSGASWTIDDEIFDEISESGFKLHLMELLDTFIAYRGQCSQSPRKQGIVRFSGGIMTMEWSPDGAAHFSN